MIECCKYTESIFVVDSILVSVVDCCVGSESVWFPLWTAVGSESVEIIIIILLDPEH